MPRLILVNRYFHPDVSATSQFATDLARRLARDRPVLVLASRQRLEAPDAALPEEAVLDGVRIHRLWSTAFGRTGLAGRALDYLSFLAAAGLWLLRHARRGDTVLAKTDPPLLGVVTAAATAGRGVTHAQWLQDLYPETATRLGVASERGALVRLVRALRDWSLRRSALVVTVSAGMLHDLRGRAGAARLVHIPNWSDDFGADSGARPPGPFRVGYSGNLGRAHPIGALLQLAEATGDPQLQFLFSGGGAHYERLRAHVRALGRANWTFLPYQPRETLGALLRQADVHLVILDPRAERHVFPSKLFGVLSAGRPVLHLGDPAGEVAQLLRDERCGWSLPADSGAAVLALLDRLRADRPALAEAGRQARRAYERRFAPSIALAAWVEALSAAEARTV